MIYLDEKDKQKISDDLKEILKSKLLDNFMNRKGKIVDSIDYINILKCDIDSEKSNRKKIVFATILIIARVWVKSTENSTSSDNIELRNSKPIEFIYDDLTDELKLSDNEIIFFDNSRY